MVKQDILAADEGEDIFLGGRRQRFWHGGQKRGILEIGAVERVEVHEAAQREGTMDTINLAVVDFQVVDQDFEDVGRHIFGNHQPYDAAEAAGADSFFNGFEKIFSFELLDGNVRIAGDVEGVGFNDVHAVKQSRQVRGDDLLQPDEAFLARGALADFFTRPGQGDKLRQGIRDLDAREVLDAVLVANQDGEVQAEI